MYALKYFYRPQTKLREGNVFRSVCQGFCPQEGGVSQHALGGGCLPGGCLPRHPPDPEADTPPPMTTEAGGMHPTGMHSCHLHFFLMKHSALGNFHFGVYYVTFTTFSNLFHNFAFVSLCQVLV